MTDSETKQKKLKRPLPPFETQLIAVLQEISNHLENTNDNLGTIANSINGIDVASTTDMSEVSHYIYKVSESIDRVQESIEEH